MEQFFLLLGDDAVGDGRFDSAGNVGALVALERLGLGKVLKAPRAEALGRVVAVDVLPVSVVSITKPSPSWLKRNTHSTR